MAESAHSLLIGAGLRLYPRCGYHKLSVRLLAAEAGISPGMFHHLFASKAAFMAEMLQQKFRAIQAQMQAQVPADAPAPQQLRQTVLGTALVIRENIAWIQRLLADSTDGVAIVGQFLATTLPAYREQLLTLLDQCEQDGLLITAPRYQRFAYLASAVFSPILIGARLQAIGLMSSEGEAAFVPQILSDQAICQRLDWALDTLMAQSGRPADCLPLSQRSEPHG